MIRPDELRRLCLNKKVFIWGAMIVGQGVCRALERNGIPVEAFVDRSPGLQGRSALGYPIHPPAEAIACARAGRALIVTGSGHNSPEIAALCENDGLSRGKDYILCAELNDIDPSVDVSGRCNLRCISCPRGNEDHQPSSGFMSAATDRRVLDKLVREIPLLGSVQLYTWGEPLLNPELPEIVAVTREAKVLSAISSNLNYAKRLEAVVAARPDWFKVSCSGWADSYERTHTGGRWDLFLSNLRQLARLRDAHHPDMQIILNYHLYRHNTGEDYRRIESLCEELSLIFIPNHAYLYPLDSIMDYVDGRELSPRAREALPMLLMTLDDGIARARKLVNLPCCEERTLPINWDCRVRECGVFFRPFVADDFLQTPLAEILRRKRSGLCVECRKRGIQHFTAVYLAEKRLDVQGASHDG